MTDVADDALSCCPKGHVLKREPAGDSWGCDELSCNRRIAPGASALLCRECNWCVCDNNNCMSAFNAKLSNQRETYTLAEDGTVTFKEGAETIKGVVHIDKEKVVSVIIPEGAKVLGEYALGGCKLLAAVTLPQTMEEIGAEAFKE